MFPPRELGEFGNALRLLEKVQKAARWVPAFAGTTTHLALLPCEFGNLMVAGAASCNFAALAQASG